MRKSKIVQIISILIFTPLTHAEINMKDASYRASFVDIKEIQRVYNSRSLHSGLFGFGWCSNLEKKLIIRTPKDISLKECDQESPFVLTDENNLLKTRTFRNPLTKEKIIFKNGTYTHDLASGETRYYNRKGQMTDVTILQGKIIHISYENDVPIALKTNQDYSLKLTYNSTNQIEKIISNDGFQASYQYEKENLIQTVNSLQLFHSYEYDKYNNLIRTTFPDKKEEHIVYNNDTDRVVKVQLKNSCIEYYDFYNAKNDPLHQVSTLTRKCEEKKTHTYIYEFWYKTRPDGLKYLDRYKIKQESQVLDITYNPYNGSPVAIIKNGKSLITQI